MARDPQASRISGLCLLFLCFLAIVIESKAEECPPGKFGWRCRLRCSCKNNEPCNSVTGDCPNGCKYNRYGRGCMLNYRNYYDKKGINYTGASNLTQNDKHCISWQDTRLEHFGYRAEHFPDGVIPGAVCRNPKTTNPGQYYYAPWCHYQEGPVIKWEICKLMLASGQCPDFTFGDSCLKDCHCYDEKQICDKVLGKCDPVQGKRCAPGWLDLTCQRNCDDGKFGENCQKTCGKCKKRCDPESGLCGNEGCQAGYAGTYCNQTCPEKYYGEGCMYACGHCQFGESCRSTDGSCPSGCEDGYTDITCKQRCQTGRYGYNCEKRCPHCLGKGPCDPQGVCMQGCSPGFRESKCDDVCKAGTFGVNCSSTCGNCKSGIACDTYTGSCVQGCAEGFTGDTCVIPLAAPTSEASVVGGAIAGVLIAIAIVIVVIGIFIFRRRRFRKVLRVSRNEHREERPTPTAETTLDNIKETDKLLRRSPSADSYPGETTENQMNELQEPIYVNVSTKKLTNPIQLQDLQDFIRTAQGNENEGFKKEHADLPSGLMALCNNALKPDNKPKNRYGNIVAYDHSRVTLALLPNSPYSDYVNANYVDGYNKPKAYIASQGPNKAMLNDFWRMVWQEKVYKIVMLTNLVETCKKKCEQYWPTEGRIDYGDTSVEILDTAEYTDYTIRTFMISQAKVNRIIKQFHFTSWSDHGAPTYPTPLLNFRRKVQQYNPDSPGPVLVHCSAGIGRSGTYIAVDYLLQQAKTEHLVDVLQCAQLMRSNRVNMIQTWEQYAFVYVALLEAILGGETTIPCSAFSDTYEQMRQVKPGNTATALEDQFDVLQRLIPTVERDECKAAVAPENVSKNRFKNILPANRCRPRLYTPVDGYNDYINAVFLSGYTNRDSYIVTQMPLPNTVADFWRMLYDYNSDTVVMLNEFDRNDKSCALYWPEEYGYTVEYGPLSIELLFSSEADTNITVRTFKLSHQVKGEDRAVKQFQFNSWPDYKSVPNNPMSFLRLMDAVQEWTKQNGKGPVTVHCMNGASKSGLYCATSLLFERMRVDIEVDVYQTIKQIRVNRPQFIENMEQYQFCHQMALTNLERSAMQT